MKYRIEMKKERAWLVARNKARSVPDEKKAKLTA